MPVQHTTFTVSSREKHQVLDVTADVARIVKASGVKDGLCAVYIPHATAAITINEPRWSGCGHDDPNIGVDLMRALAKMVPEHDGWLHDRVDDWPPFGRTCRVLRTRPMPPPTSRRRASVPPSPSRSSTARWRSALGRTCSSAN